MKKLLLIIGIMLPVIGFSQEFPNILVGTWCDSTYRIYEHWDKAGDKLLKGFSYEIKNGEKVISENIEISVQDNSLVYTVSVKNQNNEKPVSFVLSATDSVYTFVNPKHDFPTFIRYQVISPKKIKATVGNASRSFVLNYSRIE